MPENRPQDEFCEDVGRRLRAARKKLGLSTVDVAGLVGGSAKRVSTWELGDRWCSVRDITSMATAYGVSVDQLLGHIPPPSCPEEWAALSRAREKIDHLQERNRELHEQNEALRIRINEYQAAGAAGRRPQPQCGVKHWRRPTLCVQPARHKGPHDDGKGLAWTNE